MISDHVADETGAPDEVDVQASGRPSGRVDNRGGNVLYPRGARPRRGADCLTIFVSSSFSSFRRPPSPNGVQSPVNPAGHPLLSPPLTPQRQRRCSIPSRSLLGLASGRVGLGGVFATFHSHIHGAE